MQHFYPYHPRAMQFHPHQQRGQFYLPHQSPNHMNQWNQGSPFPSQSFEGSTFTNQPQQMQRQIGIEDAIRIGREQVPGEVVKVELERESGRLIYEVEIINQQGVKYEVKIDANNGAVLEVELD